MKTLILIHLLIAETVDGICKDFCLIRVVGITPILNTNAAVDYDNGIITGIAPMLDNLDSFVETSEEILTFTYSTDTIGTGTVVNVVRNGLFSREQVCWEKCQSCLIRMFFRQMK